METLWISVYYVIRELCTEIINHQSINQKKFAIAPHVERG